MITAGKPVHGGYTLARDDGRIILVRGALPGEVVTIDVDKTQRPWRGTVREVIKPSPQRQDPLWDHAGGVELGYMTLQAQRNWKQAVVEDAVTHIGNGLAEHLDKRRIRLAVRQCGDAGEGTRTRLDVDMDDNNDPCMHNRGTNDLVPISDMPLATAAINELLATTSWRTQVNPGDRVRLVDPTGSEPVVATSNGTWDWEGRRVSDHVTETLDDMSWKVRATGFWQTHTHAPATLINEVMTASRLRSTDNVVELYGGAGLLTLPMSRMARHVTMYEGDAHAVHDARVNVPDADIHQTHITAPVIRDVCQRADVVVADPARNGLGINSARHVARSNASVIVLVACDPVSMVRDVSTMVEQGRDVMSLNVYDLFPFTHHMESVVVLS